MKNRINKNFLSIFLGLTGALVAFGVTVLTVTGDVQKTIHFAGIGEEIAFALFTLIIGFLNLAMAVSSITRKE